MRRGDRGRRILFERLCELGMIERGPKVRDGLPQRVLHQQGATGDASVELRRDEPWLSFHPRGVFCPSLEKRRDSVLGNLAGWSFGGFLAPRAAALEKRIAALVANPGQWDHRETLRALPLAPEVLADMANAKPEVFEPFIRWLNSSEADPMLRWRIMQRGLWVHDVKSLYELACEVSRFEISSVVKDISRPTLLTEAEGDPVSKGAQKLYHALRCPKTLLQFTNAEGSGGHCEG